MENLYTTKVIGENSCDCVSCRQMCKNPCDATPLDIIKLINAGYEEYLMIQQCGCNMDWETYERYNNKCEILEYKFEYNVFSIKPAYSEFKLKRSPYMPYGPQDVTKLNTECSFLIPTGCLFNGTKYKPFLGRHSFGNHRFEYYPQYKTPGFIIGQGNILRLIDFIELIWSSITWQKFVRKFAKKHNINLNY